MSRQKVSLDKLAKSAYDSAMTVEQERTILEQVAAGELTPEEAMAHLDALRHGDRPGEAAPSFDDEDDGDEAPWGAPAPPEGGPAREIRVSALAGTVQVIGDPTVAEATADGEHSMHRDGDVLVIESELGDVDDERSPSAFVIGLGPGLRRFGIGRHSSLRHRRPLRVRVNPDLPIELSVSAGSLNLRGVNATIRCEVAAGTARLDGVRSPIDCSVSAGSLSVRGVLDRGESRISCDAGSVKLDLEEGSSVEVTVSANLGRVAVLTPSGGAHGSGLGFNDEKRIVVGRGEGRLEVRANLGKVLVSAPD
jgi:hypothetical protein